MSALLILLSLMSGHHHHHPLGQNITCVLIKTKIHGNTRVPFFVVFGKWEMRVGIFLYMKAGSKRRCSRYPRRQKNLSCSNVHWWLPLLRRPLRLSRLREDFYRNVWSSLCLLGWECSRSLRLSRFAGDALLVPSTLFLFLPSPSSSAPIVWWKTSAFVRQFQFVDDMLKKGSFPLFSLHVLCLRWICMFPLCAPMLSPLCIIALPSMAFVLSLCFL
jgi:hypothetical protein